MIPGVSPKPHLRPFCPVQLCPFDSQPVKQKQDKPLVLTSEEFHLVSEVLYCGYLRATLKFTVESVALHIHGRISFCEFVPYFNVVFLFKGDSTCGQRAIYHGLGLTGIPIINVNNNCATGSTALFMARQLVEGGGLLCSVHLRDCLGCSGMVDVDVHVFSCVMSCVNLVNSAS